MANNNLPFTPGIGRLATDRYDFESHINGTGFRQNASTINTDNPSLVYGDAATVEAGLENISAYITAQLNAGQGFITVGDGYNTYADANGTINYNNTIPSIDTILNPIFAAITAFQNNNTPVPSAYERIQDGGIIVIKSGTYIVKNTIIVPPGITILGEGYGTKIVNATNLNIAVMPPIVNSGSGSPIFEIAADPNRSQDDAAIDPSMFMFARETRIWNLVICDNFVEPTLLGDNYYKLPQNKEGNTPLIQQNNGSNLSLYGIFLMGRISFSSGTIVSASTTFAVQLNNSLAAKYGTILSIDKCFIDGFSVPVQWLSTGDTTTPVNRDFLTVTNSKIRGYGYLNVSGSPDSSTITSNSIIVMNDNNANIINNYIYGNAVNVQALVAMISHLPTIPNFQARSKVNVSTNNIEIDRTDNLSNTTFVPLYVASDFTNYSSTLAIGNNFQDQNLIGPVVLQTKFIMFTIQLSYTIANIGAGSTDYVLMVVPGSSASEGVVINLPLVINNIGRSIVIKAMKNTTYSSPVTIQTQGSDTIEFDGPTSYMITVPFTSITFVAVNNSGIYFWALI